MTDSYIIFSKILGLKCQKQKHSKNIVLLWPCGHKDQSFLAFWYKSKQDIFKEVKIQMKKKIFKKTFVAVCQIHCHIHCRIQYDIVENVFSDKF